jgi:hypothetical protein
MKAGDHAQRLECANWRSRTPDPARCQVAALRITTDNQQLATGNWQHATL